MKLGEDKARFSPNRAYSVGIFNHFGNCIALADLVFSTSCDRLFYEHSYAGKVLENLQFNVPSRFCRTTVHGGASNNDGLGPVTGGHVLDEVLKGFEDAGVLVRRYHERVTFLLKNCSGTFHDWIYKGYDLETSTKFTALSVSY
jgi:hypothetical protein